MILEGLVTTLGQDGVINVAPMGPRVELAAGTGDLISLVLRPFRTARTFANLQFHPEGVFHVTDDVLLLARAALGTLDPSPAMTPANQVRGWVLADACRFYEFRLTDWKDGAERVEMPAQILHHGKTRDFLGFNRARHAVVEAAILASRTGFLALEPIRAEFQRLAVLVQKTGGPREREAFSLLEKHIARAEESANHCPANPV
jgi:hypothetical protein